jgi:hypothetical protein
VAVVHRLSGGLPREINVIASYSMLTCFVEDQHQVTTEHVRTVMTEYGFQGVTDLPEEEEPAVEPAKTKVQAALDDAPLATEEKPSPAKPEENKSEPSPPMYETTTTNAMDSIRKLSPSKTVVAALGLAVVAGVLIAWILLKSAPAVEEALPPTDSKAAAPSEESSTPDQAPPPDTGDQSAPSMEAKPEDVDTDESNVEAASVETTPPVEPAPPPERDILPIIKLDMDLADDLNQPVTVQIAALLDPEQAESSLARVSELADMPGAIQIVTGRVTTWYLVLLGHFNSAEEAEAAVQPILPILQEQAVTEVRIKRAPSWLQAHLSEQVRN